MAGASAVLRTPAVTVNVCPGTTVAGPPPAGGGVSVADSTARFGWRITTVASGVTASALLILSDSTIALSRSATALRKYSPATRLDGTVSFGDSVIRVPAASPGTFTVPSSVPVPGVA